MSTLDLHMRPRGLITDPSSTAAPDGALRQALDCVLRRPGIVEPRPGFREGVTTWDPSTSLGSSNYRARALIPWTRSRDILIASRNGSTWDWRSNTAEAVSTADPPDETSEHIGYAEAHARQYYCRAASGGGVGLIAAEEYDANADAGVRRAEQGTLTLIDAPIAAGEFLPDTKWVGYRVVVRYSGSEDNYVVRSPPSGKMLIQNTTGGAATKAVRLTIPVAAWLNDYITLATIEVYRTAVADSSEVGEEFALCAEHFITGADEGAGFCTINDYCADGARGALLYTNPSQLTELQANTRPPACLDVAHFNGSMFYANVTDQPRQTLRLTSRRAWGMWGSDASISGDITAGAPATITSIAGITGVAGTAGLRVGMLVAEVGQTPGSNGTHIVWPTRIASVTGSNSITLDTNTLGSDTSVDLVFLDTIELSGSGGAAFFAWSAVADLTDHDSWFQFRADVSGSYSAREILQDFSYAANRITTRILSSFGSSDEDALLLFEHADWTTTTITITNGEQWSPRTEATQATTLSPVVWTVAAEETPGRLMWSRAGLPEAVPIVNFADVGASHSDIWRIVATQDALWICKTDGIWRLTGDGADAGWRIDRQSGARIVHPKCAATYGDVGVVWTDKGLLPLGLQVGERLDGAIATDLEAYAALLLASSTPAGGTFVRASKSNQEIYVGCPAEADDTETSIVYVLNTGTGAWTAWSLALSDIVEDATGKLWIGKPGTGLDSYGLAQERTSGVECADLSYTITLEAGETLAYEATAGSGWTPEVGDLVVRDTEPQSYAFVTSVSSGEFTLSGTLTMGAGTAYKSYGSVIEWIAKTSNSPGSLKFWRSISVWWEKLYGTTSAYQYSVGFKTEHRPTTDTADVQVVSLARNPATSQVALAALHVQDLGPIFEPAPIQSYVPRNYAVAATLRPRIEIRQAGVCWALSALDVDGEGIGKALRRSYAAS